MKLTDMCIYQDIEEEEGSPVLGHIPTMPSEELMKAELAIITGGRDQEGRPIITIPSKQFGIIKSTALEEVIKYYIAITRPQVKHAGFGFVVDFSRANETMIDIIIATLNTVQAQLKGAVAMLYAVSPIIKALRKHMLAKLGLRKSKKAKYKSMPQPLFKSTAHYNISDLYNYVDKSHLTQDLGGYMNYDHQAWVKFRKVFEPFYRDAEEVIKRIPSAFQQLTALSDFPKAKTLDEIQEIKTRLQQENEDIKGDLGLEPMLSQCNSLLGKLKKPDDNSIFVSMAQKPMFKDTLHITERYHERLNGADQKADVLFQKAMRKIDQSLQHLQFESNLNQLIDWINNKGMVYLKSNIEVPDSLSRSEILKHHFETGFLSSAKEVIQHSEALIQQADEMVIKDHYNIPVILATSKNFTKVVQQFKDALQRRHQILHHCSVFYLLLEKCIQWYRKTLTFLPPELLDHKEFFVSPSGNHRKHPYLMTLEWREESKRFLRKHPSPSSEELQRLKDSVLLVADMKVRTQARLLIHRCLWLKCLFNNKEKVSPKEMLKILQWQTNYLEGYDDIELCEEDSEESDNIKGKSKSSPKQRLKQREKVDKKLTNRRDEDDDDDFDGTPNRHQDKSQGKGDRRDNRYGDTHSDKQDDTAPYGTEHKRYHRHNNLQSGVQNDSDGLEDSGVKKRVKSRHRRSQTDTRNGRRYSDTNLYKSSDTDPKRHHNRSPQQGSPRLSDHSPHRLGNDDTNMDASSDRLKANTGDDCKGSDGFINKKHVSISTEKPSFYEDNVTAISMPNLHQPSLHENDSQNQTYGIYGDSDDMEGVLNGPPRDLVDFRGKTGLDHPMTGIQPNNMQWPYMIPSQQFAQTRWTSSDALLCNQPNHAGINNTTPGQMPNYSLGSTPAVTSNAWQTPHRAMSLYQTQNGVTYTIPAIGLQNRHISPSNTDSGFTYSSPNLSGNTNSSFQESPLSGTHTQTQHVNLGLPRNASSIDTISDLLLQNQLANQLLASPSLANQMRQGYVNQDKQKTSVQSIHQGYLSPIDQYRRLPYQSISANQTRVLPNSVSQLTAQHGNQPGFILTQSQPPLTSLPLSTNQYSLSEINQLTTPPFMSSLPSEQRASSANQSHSSVPSMSNVPAQITANQLQLPTPSSHSQTTSTPLNSHLTQRRDLRRLSGLSHSSYLTPLEKLELEVSHDRKQLEQDIQFDRASRQRAAYQGIHQTMMNDRPLDLTVQDQRLSDGQMASIEDMNLVESSLIEQLSNLLVPQREDAAADETQSGSARERKPTLTRNVSSDGAVSGTENDLTLQEYRSMLDEAKKLRLASEESLLQEKQRYESLRLQQEELTQTQVEESLKRSEKLLQEEEDVMKQEEELDKLIKLDDERQQQKSPRQLSPRQPASLSPQMRTPMSLEEELKTLEKEEQRLQRRVLRRGSSLQLSDEGIVLDNTSPDDLVDRASLESSNGSAAHRKSKLNAFKVIQDLESDELVAFIENNTKRRPSLKLTGRQEKLTIDERLPSDDQEKNIAKKLLQDKLENEDQDVFYEGSEKQTDEFVYGDKTGNGMQWEQQNIPEISLDY
ncbi:uncharacterized protein [Ptychodera flava]|uniref:uncharacterized protein isoform X2 n=1 Tax=Ptychodera flava TaxID=63121 RepID=UPI00396A44D2